jgi:predicted Holliday junction resolvase-like endonuclease
MNLYMKRNGVNLKLQRRIRNYLEFVRKQEIENDEAVLTVIEKLSKDLQDELSKNVKYNFLKKSRFISKNFSPDFTTEVIPLMQEQKYNPQEILFQV